MLSILLSFLAIASCTARISPIDHRWVGWHYSHYGCESDHILELDDDSNVYLCNYKVNVRYDRNSVAIYEYPNTDLAKILINHTEVVFKGHIVPVSKDPNESNYHEIIIKTALDGSGRVTKTTTQGQDRDILDDCDLHLSTVRSKTDNGVLPGRLQMEIIRTAQNSIKSAMICDDIRVLNRFDRKEFPYEYSVGPLSIAPQKTISQHEMLSTNNVDYNSGYMSQLTSLKQSDLNSIKRIGLQGTINMLVDLAIAEFVRKIREENNGYFKLPDISERFSESTFWKPHGEFDAINGVFSDLTTLSRNGNAGLSHQGLKFIATCGFGLSRANLSYQQYKLKYGLSVSGKLSADIDGFAILVSAAVDYNQKPCRVVLQDLQITDLGQLKIHLTGVGPLNKIVSKLITWITKKWQEDIVRMIESRIRTLIQSHLNMFNCERFRP